MKQSELGISMGPFYGKISEQLKKQGFEGDFRHFDKIQDAIFRLRINDLLPDWSIDRDWETAPY